MVIFVIPVYNEAGNIPSLLEGTSRKMRELGLTYRIIIINDGSTDKTLEIVNSFKDNIPLEVYSYYPNKGVGQAFRRGFEKAIDICREGDIVVTKEADNTSDLDILDKLIAKVREGYELVLSSCYAREGGVIGTTLFRLMLSKCANLLMRLLLPVKGIHTYSSFYRAYSAGALKEMSRLYGKSSIIEQPGFECMVELLVKFSRAGHFKICEVPMVLDGGKRKGKSKMRIIKTTAGFLKVILKEGIIYRLRRIFNRDDKR